MFHSEIISLDPNSTVIEKMLMLVNKYGLSHVCALPEFQNIEKQVFTLAYNFPYLDIYLPDHSNSRIEFYYRGAKDRNIKFKNLFEYLLWTADNGKG